MAKFKYLKLNYGNKARELSVSSRRKERERDKKSVRSQVYDKYSQKKNGAALREYWYVNWR